MKLTKILKERIDKYFDSISSAELYRISISKYGFAENTNLEIDNQTFDTLSVDNYVCNENNGFDVFTESSMPLAA